MHGAQGQEPDWGCAFGSHQVIGDVQGLNAVAAEPLEERREARPVRGESGVRCPGAKRRRSFKGGGVTVRSVTS